MKFPVRDKESCVRKHTHTHTHTHTNTDINTQSKAHMDRHPHTSDIQLSGSAVSSRTLQSSTQCDASVQTSSKSGDVSHNRWITMIKYGGNNYTGKKIPSLSTIQHSGLTSCCLLPSTVCSWNNGHRLMFYVCGPNPKLNPGDMKL